jgi:hypothetical protein
LNFFFQIFFFLVLHSPPKSFFVFPHFFFFFLKLCDFNFHQQHNLTWVSLYARLLNRNQPILRLSCCGRHTCCKIVKNFVEEQKVPKERNAFSAIEILKKFNSSQTNIFKQHTKQTSMVNLSSTDDWDRLDRGRFLAYGGLFILLVLISF